MQVSALWFLRWFLFPGGVFAVLAAWFFLWVERKTAARLQQRIGPPMLQPFYDFVKLMGKESLGFDSLEHAMMKMWPALSVAAMLGALPLLPVLPGEGFSGDFILLVTLLELPSMFFILAGFTSRSMFGKIGAMREASLSLATNLLFLVAVMMIAVAAHSFRLAELAQAKLSPLGWLGIVAIVACIPAKLRLNPFSISSAEQEIYAGPLTEYSGGDLALWELAHGLEWLALCGLVASLLLPHLALLGVQALLFVVFCCVLVLLLALLAAATARYTIDSSVRFYWRWGAALGIVFLVAVILYRGWGATL